MQANRGSVRTGWLRPSLLVVEVAAAVVLLAGSGLLIRSFHRLNQVETGFDAERLLTMRFFLPRVSYPPARSVQLYEQMIERATALPGVEAAAAVSAFPFSGTTANVAFAIPSQPPYPPGQGPNGAFAAVTPGFFRTMGMRLDLGKKHRGHRSCGGAIRGRRQSSDGESVFRGPGSDRTDDPHSRPPSAHRRRHRRGRPAAQARLRSGAGDLRAARAITHSAACSSSSARRPTGPSS